MQLFTEENLPKVNQLVINRAGASTRFLFLCLIFLFLSSSFSQRGEPGTREVLYNIPKS